MDLSKYQEIFNTVFAGLASQGWQMSVNHTGSCMYRGGEDGMKCAAGHLIPDAAYDVKWEGCTADDVPFFAENFSAEEFEMIDDFQYLHDSFFGEETDCNGMTMKDAFENYARQHNLTIPE